MSVIFTSVHCSAEESIEMCCEREIHEEEGVRDVSVIFTSVYCSAGESIEMCCELEIHEEVGVRV